MTLHTDFTTRNCNRSPNIHIMNSTGRFQMGIKPQSNGRGFAQSKITSFLIQSIACFILVFYSHSISAQTDDTLVCRLTYRSDSTVASSEHRVYDEKSTLAVTITYTYDERGVVDTRQLCSFNRQRQLIQRMIYSADDVLLMEERFKYDRHGNLTKREQTTYEDEQPMTTIETRRYSYHKDGTIENCEYYINGQLYYQSGQ